MRGIAAGITVLAFVFCSVPGFARTANTSASVSAHLDSTTPGACSANSSDYDHFCPSGNCSCLEYSGTIRGGLIGRGTVNVSLTLDDDAVTATPGCQPFFAEVSYSTTRDTGTVNATGTICKSISRKPLDPVTGGVGLKDSGVGAVGWGTLGGTRNSSSNALSLKLTMRITQ